MNRPPLQSPPDSPGDMPLAVEAEADPERIALVDSCPYRRQQPGITVHRKGLYTGFESPSIFDSARHKSTAEHSIPCTAKDHSGWELAASLKPAPLSRQCAAMIVTINISVSVISQTMYEGRALSPSLESRHWYSTSLSLLCAVMIKTSPLLSARRDPNLSSGYRKNNQERGIGSRTIAQHATGPMVCLSQD